MRMLGQLGSGERNVLKMASFHSPDFFHCKNNTLNLRSLNLVL